ncbi:MAG: DUF962 domain-containing protein [Limimaricola sp.]|nr:DUF962 domain-containing protein [Limimaricola sp.]
MTRRIERLLAEYGESHQNPTNKAVHWVCVPLIVWSVLALVASIPGPGAGQGVRWITLLLILAMFYYIWISPTLAVGIAVFAGLCLWVISLVQGAGLPLWQVAAAVFVLAWIGQFWGHKVEGRKPSFLKDLQFLLIGPAWLLSFLYKRAGIPV